MNKKNLDTAVKKKTTNEIWYDKEVALLAEGNFKFTPEPITRKVKIKIKK